MNFIEYIGSTVVLYAILGFFIKVWINGLHETMAKIISTLETKVDEKNCIERMCTIKEKVAEIKEGNKGEHAELFDRMHKLGG